MCVEAHRLTHRSLGSDIGGPLSEKPPAYPLTREMWIDANCNEYELLRLSELTRSAMETGRVLPFKLFLMYIPMAHTTRLIKRTIYDSWPDILMRSAAMCAIVFIQGPKACWDFVNRNDPIVNLIFPYFLNDRSPFNHHPAQVDQATLYFGFFPGVPQWAQELMDAILYWLIMDLCLSQPHYFFCKVITAIWAFLSNQAGKVW